MNNSWDKELITESVLLPIKIPASDLRNAINAQEDFNFNTSLSSLAHLLQVLFAEMETHAFK